MTEMSIHKTKTMIFRITRSIHRTRPRIPANIHQYTTTIIHPRENNLIILFLVFKTPRIHGTKKQALTPPTSFDSSCKHRITKFLTGRLIFYGNQDAQKMSTKIMSLQNRALNAKMIGMICSQSIRVDQFLIKNILNFLKMSKFCCFLLDMHVAYITNEAT